MFINNQQPAFTTKMLAVVIVDKGGISSRLIEDIFGPNGLIFL